MLLSLFKHFELSSGKRLQIPLNPQHLKCLIHAHFQKSLNPKYLKCLIHAHFQKSLNPIIYIFSSFYLHFVIKSADALIHSFMGLSSSLDICSFVKVTIDDMCDKNIFRLSKLTDYDWPKAESSASNCFWSIDLRFVLKDFW